MTTSAAAPRIRGPAVWLDMDQQELDDAYDQVVYAPNAAQLHERREARSAETRRRLGEPRRLAYGPTPIERLDLFATDQPKAPIAVIIHGGAWKAGRAREFADAVEIFVRAGGHCIIPDFINVIEAQGSLFPMADQVRRAIAWIARNATTFGGDPDRIHIFGRSSGAHLGGVAITTDWQNDFGLPGTIIKSALLSSGMYDLKPVRLSKRSAYIAFTDPMEHALSPQRHLHRVNCPVIVAFGSCETPEFQRQARDFSAALAAAGKPVQLLIGAGYNHFEMPETLANPYGLLGRAMLAQMKLAAP